MHARELHPALVSAAKRRGSLWGERVARLLVARWPSWRPSPRALSIAARKVADLAGGDPEATGDLARVAFEAAAKRFRELAEFLDGRRLGVPPATDDETPK
ncbi:MAG: hypothetical protein JWM53_958 [bacterium]|nr:hypothetical protein [bacterium]